MPTLIHLTWADPNSNESGHRVYRSTSPMNVASLPAPIADLGPNVTQYLDDSVAEGTLYYYRVGAYNASGEAVSAEVSATAGTAPAADAYWSSVTTMLHFNGADASTVFTDAKGGTWTVGAPAQITTAESVFGGACGKFIYPGSGAYPYISRAHATDYKFGTADMCVELRFKTPDIAAAGKILDFGGINFALSINNSRLSILIGGVEQCLSNVLASNTWYAVKFNHVAGVWRLFVNGSVTPTTYTDAVGVYDATGMSVARNYADTGFPKNVYIDELRITKGNGRGIANYTPSSAPFPDA